MQLQSDTFPCIISKLISTESSVEKKVEQMSENVKSIF